MSVLVGGSILVNTQSTDTDAVSKTLRQYAEATRNYDWKALDRLFAPEYVEVSPLGEVDVRDKAISFYKQPGPSPDSIAFDELTVRYPGRDFAVAIFRETATIKRGEKEVTMPFRVTVGLKRHGKEWQLYSSQFVAIRLKQ